jgi:hypothetical protein
MERRSTRGYEASAQCAQGHENRVTFTLPDFGDAVALYQCRQCRALIGVDPDAEHYVGPAWDTLRTSAVCPDCGAELLDARSYPDAFGCSHCAAVGSFTPPETYPEAGDVPIEFWDPYAR